LKFIPSSRLHRVSPRPLGWNLQQYMWRLWYYLVSIFLRQSSEHWRNVIPAMNFASTTLGSTIVVTTFTQAR
jgi:hypothetical protein